MNFEEQYKTAFSHVQTAIDLKEEDFYHMKRPVHGIRKSAVILAAIICLLVACSVTAFAANLFGLKDLILHENSGIAPAVTTGSHDSDPDGSEQPTTLISLQGFSGSNEYKAAMEWAAFLATYDQDGALLAKVGNGPTGLPEKYSQYYVYTQEMADKLDEITAKYNLKLHRSIDVFDSKEAFYAQAGLGDFLGRNNTDCSPYMFDDGTFHIDGSSAFPDGQFMQYQFMDCKKGVFTDTLLNIGNADDYTEWSYQTSSGVTVCLASSPSKCLIFADLKGSFVTVNVLAGTAEDSGNITPENLQELADSFDFSMLH